MESHPRICLGLVALPVGSVLSPFFASPDSFSSMCVCGQFSGWVPVPIAAAVAATTPPCGQGTLLTIWI